MRLTWRRTTAATAAGAAISLLLGGLAMADQAVVDNDTSHGGQQPVPAVSAAPGATVNVSWPIVVNYQGGHHLDGSQSLVFAYKSGLPAGATTPDITVAIPSTWGGPTSVVATASGTLSFTAPSTPGQYQYTVVYSNPSGYSCDSTADCLTGSDSSSNVNGTLTLNVSTPTSTNDAPTANAGGPYSTDEGTGVQLDGSASTDPNVGDTLSYDWSAVNADSSALGTCSFDDNTLELPTITCDDNGTYTVSLTVTDNHGAASSPSTATLTVNNVAPSVGTLTPGGATGTACIGGNNVTLDFGFSDPGTIDNPWAVDINWGDGSTDTTYNASTQGPQTQQSHSYGAGSYTISVSVTDKDGGLGSNSSVQGAVSHLYNMSGILAPFNGDGSSVWKYGSTVPVKVQITDCASHPVSGLAPKVGTSTISSTDPTQSIDETQSTSAADTTGVMRYDTTSGQYIYNFGTKYLSDPSATYYMTVKGTDSSGNIVTSPAVVQQKFGLKSK